MLRLESLRILLMVLWAALQSQRRWAHYAIFLSYFFESTWLNRHSWILERANDCSGLLCESRGGKQILECFTSSAHFYMICRLVILPSWTFEAAMSGSGQLLASLCWTSCQGWQKINRLSSCLNLICLYWIEPIEWFAFCSIHCSICTALLQCHHNTPWVGLKRIELNHFYIWGAK